MSALGPYLRELRERRGFSLEEISRATRVPRQYLEALESADLDQLPVPVFVRGFIRAYCQVLGQSPDEALRLYREDTGEVGPNVTEHVPRRRESASQSRGPLLVSFVLLVVLGAALFAVTIALQSGRGRAPEGRAEVSRTEVPPATGGPPSPSRTVAPSQPGSPDMGTSVATSAPATPPTAGAPPSPKAPPANAASSSVTATGRPAAPAAAPSRSETATAPATAATPPTAATPAKPAPTAPADTSAPVKEAERIAAAIAGASPYRLIARTTAPTWIRVRTEDGHSSEETIPAGQVREWVSDRRFIVTVGNSGGVTLELNGRALPVLGAAGEVTKLVLPPDSTAKPESP